MRRKMEQVEAFHLLPVRSLEILMETMKAVNRYSFLAPPPLAFDSKASGRNGFGVGEISPTLRAMNHTEGNQNAGGQVAIAFQSSQSGVREVETHPTLDANNESRRQNGVITFESRFARNGRGAPSEIVPPLKAQSGQTGKGDAAPLTTDGYAVRRLTVIECSRLQGFDDLYLHIETASRRKVEADEAEYMMNHGLRCWEEDDQWYTKIAADGPMYRALGNSQAVPVMAWIGKRIAAAQENR